MAEHDETQRDPEYDRLAEPVKAAIDYAATQFEGAASTSRAVTMQRTAAAQTADQALWSAIRNRTDAIGFNRYSAFIHRVLCEDTDTGAAVCTDSRAEAPRTAGDLGSPSIRERRQELERRPSIYGVDAYQLLKIATQAFLIFEAGVAIKPPRNPDNGQDSVVLTEPVPGEESRLGRSVTFEEIQAELEGYLTTTVGNVGGRALPYLKRIVNALLPPGSRQERLPYCEAVLRRRVSCPSLLELIWSYWHEEGMLVQTMNAVAMRFQNRRLRPVDPLATLEIDPLRPLNNLLWGFIQDEYNRLSIKRRVYEYDHHYGLTLYGKAVPQLEAADSRSKFIEAFHNLLHRAAVFYQEDADTTVISDGFPLLNALKEVHLLLSEGAHNQFGDLPWTARAEMLTMEWLLARPEMRDFLRGRAMVPYREPWMGAVDSMKKLQGWTDVSVSHFRDLGSFGEQILLSIRYGDWIDVNDQEQARNWARYWKPEIQSYLHSYLAVTGVDLTTDITDTRRATDRFLPPSVHLRNRLALQKARGLPSPAQPGNELSPDARNYLEPQFAVRNR